MTKTILLLCFSLISSLVYSQNFPSRTTKMIVPFETGTPDSIARILAPQLSTLTNQSYYVENHPGANGMIGADLVAKAKPDGYTLLVTSTSITVNPSYYKKLSYTSRPEC